MRLKKKIEKLESDTKASFKNFFDGVKGNMVDIQKNTERILKLELLVAEMNVKDKLTWSEVLDLVYKDPYNQEKSKDSEPAFIPNPKHKISTDYLPKDKAIGCECPCGFINRAEEMRLISLSKVKTQDKEIKQLKENWTNHLKKWKNYFLDFASRFAYVNLNNSGAVKKLSDEFANKIIEFSCIERPKDSEPDIIYAKESFMDLQKMLEQQKIIISGKNEEIEKLKKAHKINVDYQNKAILKIKAEYGECLNEKSKLRHLVADKDKKLEYYLSDCNGVGIICKPNDKIKQVLELVKKITSDEWTQWLTEMKEILEKKT